MDRNDQLLRKTSGMNIENLCPRFSICRTTWNSCFDSHVKCNTERRYIWTVRHA